MIYIYIYDIIYLYMFVHPAGDVAGLDSENDGVHEVPGSLDQWTRRVKTRHNKLSGYIVDIRLDLAGDVELVAVERYPLQVGQQVALGWWLWTLVRDIPSQLVQLLPRLTVKN